MNNRIFLENFESFRGEMPADDLAEVLDWEKKIPAAIPDRRRDGKNSLEYIFTSCKIKCEFFWLFFQLGRNFHDDVDGTFFGWGEVLCFKALLI